MALSHVSMDGVGCFKDSIVSCVYGGGGGGLWCFKISIVSCVY